MVKVLLLCVVFRALLVVQGKGTFYHSDDTSRVIENACIHACNEHCKYHKLLGNVGI